MIYLKHIDIKKMLNSLHGLWKFFNREQKLIGEAIFDEGTVRTEWGEICKNEDELLDFCEIRYI